MRTTLLFSLLPIVSVVIVLFILLVLPDHSFHDFHASLKRNWVSSTLSFLSSFLVVIFIFVVFLTLFLLFFELINVAIPNIPLSYFTSEIICDWWASSSSSLLYVRIYGLNLTTFVVKFVSHCLLNSLYIFAWSRLFLLGLPSEFFKVSLSNILNFFLDFILVLTCMDVVTLETEMHDHLVNSIIEFIFSLIIIVHYFIGRCNWIGCD